MKHKLTENEFRDLVMRHTVGLLSALTRHWGSLATERIIEFLRKNGHLTG